jgi:hypothetical protein
MIAGRPHYTLARPDGWNVLGSDFFGLHEVSVYTDDMRRRVQLDFPRTKLSILKQRSKVVTHPYEYYHTFYNWGEGD